MFYNIHIPEVQCAICGMVLHLKAADDNMLVAASGQLIRCAGEDGPEVTGWLCETHQHLIGKEVAWFHPVFGPEELQLSLRMLMCELSEEYFSAGWETNFEYILWGWICEDADVTECWCRGVTDAHLTEVQELMVKAKCWFILRDDIEPSPIGLGPWEDVIYPHWKQLMSDRGVFR